MSQLEDQLNNANALNLKSLFLNILNRVKNLQSGVTKVLRLEGVKTNISLTQKSGTTSTLTATSNGVAGHIHCLLDIGITDQRDLVTFNFGKTYNEPPVVYIKVYSIFEGQIQINSYGFSVTTTNFTINTTEILEAGKTIIIDYIIAS